MAFDQGPYSPFYADEDKLQNARSDCCRGFKLIFGFSFVPSMPLSFSSLPLPPPPLVQHCPCPQATYITNLQCRQIGSLLCCACSFGTAAPFQTLGQGQLGRGKGEGERCDGQVGTHWQHANPFRAACVPVDHQLDCPGLGQSSSFSIVNASLQMRAKVYKKSCSQERQLHLSVWFLHFKCNDIYFDVFFFVYFNY